jgi:hypothetical protein
MQAGSQMEKDQRAKRGPKAKARGRDEEAAGRPHTHVYHVLCAASYRRSLGVWTVLE